MDATGWTQTDGRRRVDADGWDGSRMDRPVGLRERKKAATRQAVHRAALRLAVEHGFDRVTVEAIAEAADISRRTFSNYFADKEDALLHGDEQRMRALVAEARRRSEERRVGKEG